MTNERRETIKARLWEAERKFQCTRCGQKFTVLVSLNCNCGGDIKPIGEVDA